ncbi:oxidoreductase [Paenibacillus yonginensis]|uniref:Oxidoreductase n=1 Tax=Paenibacillus yonginensis TaxID=1462996 RepID=A0A1B1MW97_9BACL|nr:Gfo/Idh/MocA family oxidoreductase [Paenibacillus yonginensis]ANS73453.1 oxidoreductase [Paenibacillus yonginensis]
MIRFGIIGTNWITDRFIEAATEAEGFVLSAVYSRTSEKAQAFAEKHNIPNTYTDLNTMLESDTIDAVYIASPNSLHASQAIEAMNRGKHVLCEKPAASNAREVKAVIEAAKANNVVFMEALKTTLLPNFRTIRDNLNKIGPIRRYIANFCQYSSRYDAYKEGEILNAFKPEFSNGALMDLGIYGIYPMVTLFGKPSTVKATGYMLESGVDGEGTLIASYPEMDAVVMYSKITDSALPSEIQGELGSIVIDKLSEPHHVVIRYRDGHEEDISIPTALPTMTYETVEFMKMIRQGSIESTVNSHERTLISAEIMDEARRQLGLVYPADQTGMY